ncbi:hypothetical protein P8C59_004350 [Phyllachora maydis]|uniref:Uncharacterized protein n=1 Tax=Phyllachora maydis TaxID=1825666 RepID=A0AAD9I232_9PEZI|nr:hypothetical protein P8C59_004350 [Phyllachora maydis]
MADQAKGKGIAPKRASNLADLGQFSRPLLPIRTLLEDKEDGEDYSKVIEVLKQYIKSYKRDTITSSIVKELSKKAYTIPDDKTPDISNTYSNSDQAVLLMLLRDSLSSSPRAAISRPIESKKKDVYNEFYALTFSTYKKGLLAFTAEFNGYLAKLTIAKIDIDPSLILDHLNIEYLMANILEESRNLAIEAYRAAYIANSSNSTLIQILTLASFILGSYNLAIEEEEEESNSSSNSSSSSDSNT